MRRYEAVLAMVALGIIPTLGCNASAPAQPASATTTTVAPTTTTEWSYTPNPSRVPTTADCIDPTAPEYAPDGSDYTGCEPDDLGPEYEYGDPDADYREWVDEVWGEYEEGESPDEPPYPYYGP